MFPNLVTISAMKGECKSFTEVRRLLGACAFDRILGVALRTRRGAALRTTKEVRVEPGAREVGTEAEGSVGSGNNSQEGGLQESAEVLTTIL